MFAQLISSIVRFFSFSNTETTREKNSAPVSQNIFVPNVHHALTLFLTAIEHNGASASTLRNYASDISQYLDFSAKEDINQAFESQILDQFGLDQQARGLKESSILRKVASLKQFAKWLEKQGWLHQPSFLQQHFKPPLPITSVPPAFQNFFWFKGLKNTVDKFSLVTALHIFTLGLFCVFLLVFGYRQLFSQAVSSLAFPTAPNRPQRVLSFQGRLTDAASSPITTASNVQFRLYDASTVGNQLWASGTCSIDPDQDGIFSTLLGSSCGSEIASNVFSENQQVWLEIQVGAETLTPRQQIATVAYALNSETLQGFPVSSTESATINTVLVMNEWGEVSLGENSPKLKSISGTFTVEGQALTLQTASGSNGEITLDPDGTGGVNIVGATTSQDIIEVTSSTLTTGKLFEGTVSNNNTGYKFLSFLGGSSPDEKFSVDALGNVIADGYLAAPGATLSATYSGATPLVINGTGGQILSIANGGNITAAGAISGLTGISSSGTANFTGTFQLSGTTVTATAAELNYLDGTTVTAGGVIYGNGTYLANTGAGVSGECLTSNGAGTPTWASCGAGGGSSKWNITNGTLQPINTTLDLLVGGTASSAAKFAVLNVNSGTPTASLSAGISGGAYLTAGGNLQTTDNQTLTLGGNTTGNILLNPLNGSGRTTISSDLYILDRILTTQNGVNEIDMYDTGFSMASYLGFTVKLDNDNNDSSEAFTISTNGNTTTLLSVAGSGNINAARTITGTTSLDLLTSTFTNQTSSGTQQGIVLTNANDAANAVTENFLFIDNAETTASTLTDAILITSSGVNGGVVDGLDVSDSNITNAVNFGSNVLLGTTGNIDMTNFDVVGSSGDITTAGDIAINGDDITSDGNLSINATGYVRIGDSGTPGTANGDDDLYVEGDLEVDGTLIATDFSCPNCFDFADFEDTLDLDASTEINFSTNNFTFDLDSTGDFLLQDAGDTVVTFSDSGNLTFDGDSARSVSITSDLSGGSRSTALLNITQANDGTNNQSSNLINFQNSDTASTGVLLNLDQRGTAGRALNLASGVTTGELAYFNIGGLTSGTALKIDNPTSGTNFSGDLINSLYQVTYANASTMTHSGNFLDLNRNLTVNNASGTIAITGDLATLSSSCTQTSGTCTDNSNILSVAQNFSGATGALVDLTNAGTGAGLLLTSSSTGGLATLNASGAVTVPDGLLIAATNGSGIITDAIDVSDAEIVNALNIGTNTILGTTGVIDFTNFDMDGSTGNITTAGDIALNGDDLTSDSNLSISTTGYVKIGDSGSPTASRADGDDDLYVQGDVEVDGNLYIDGTWSYGGVTIEATAADINYLDGVTVTAGGVMYGNGTHIANTGAGSAGQCLISNGASAPAWASCTTYGSYWRTNDGTISPINNTFDLLVGSNASASAKFAVLNVNSGTPTASVSAGTTGAAYLTAAGTLQTTAAQTFTVGGNTTGNIVLMPRGNDIGLGRVGINDSSPDAALNIYASTGTYATHIQYDNTGFGGQEFVGLYLEGLNADSGNAVGLRNEHGIFYSNNQLIMMDNAFVSNDNGTIYGIRNSAQGADKLFNDTGTSTYYGYTNEFVAADIVDTTNFYGLYNDIQGLNTGTSTQTIYGTYQVGTTFSQGSDIFYGHYVTSSGSSTGGTQYAYYANMSSGTATKYGFHITGETTNILSGDLEVNGDDIASDGNLTLSATGYVRVGDSATPGLASGDDDLYIQDDLELDDNFFHDGGVIQKGGAEITGTSDLGLYSRTSTAWMRFVTNAGHFRWYMDDDAGSTSVMNLTTNGRLVLGDTVTPGGDFEVQKASTGIFRANNTTTALTTNDRLGTFSFYANDASTNGTGEKAAIDAIAEDTTGNAIAMVFRTSGAGAATGTEQLRITSAGQLLGVAGSASVPTYSITGDTNTGIFSATADTVEFATGGSNNLDITSLGIRFSSTGNGVTCDSTTVGTLLYNRDIGEDGRIYSCRQTSAGSPTYAWVGMNSTAVSPDLAEYVSANDLSIEAGDIVSLASTEINDGDKYDRFKVEKSLEETQNLVMGVISTEPGIILNDKGQKVLGESNVTPDQKPLALTGRVPVKIATAGTVTKGSFITASSVAGYGQVALEAGQVVGQTLTSFSPTNRTCTTITDPTQANWSGDSFDRCFQLPDGTYLAKVLVFVKVGYHNPDIQLAANGSILSKESLQDLLINDQEVKDTLLQSIQNTLSQMSTLIVNASQLIANIGVFNQRVETPNLATNLITPLSGEDLTLSIGQPNSATSSGTLAVKNSLSQEVFTLNESGDATFSGEITATSARFQALESKFAQLDQLDVKDATIAGQLYLSDGRSIADTLSDNERYFTELLASSSAQPQEIENNSYNEFLAKLTGTQDAELSALVQSLQSQNIMLESDDVILHTDAIFIHKFLSVTGLTQLATVNVTDAMKVTNDLLFDSQGISSQENLLSLQPSGQGQVKILGNLLVLNDAGSVEINGDLSVTGTLATNTLSPHNFGQDLNIKLATQSGEVLGTQASKLSIRNQDNTEVANITASGSARFSQLETQGVTISQKDLEEKNKTTGTKSLPAGQTEIVIENNTISTDSLVYLTPTNDPQNQVLFVKAKNSCQENQVDCQKSFTVGINTAVANQIEFNYWIVKTTN